VEATKKPFSRQQVQIAAQVLAEGGAFLRKKRDIIQKDRFVDRIKPAMDSQRTLIVCCINYHNNNEPFTHKIRWVGLKIFELQQM
jgi:hypothetical protein